MMRTLTLAVATLHLALTLPSVTQAQPTATTEASRSQSQRVDELFAKWNKPDSPGGVVAVIQNGTIVYSHGYGMANLEYGVRNTSSTVFHMASVSKQFTACAIYLLAQDGKLSIDDDIRHYVPELHDFGHTITIRHLLHHTSGLRDQWNLLALAGWRLEDVITEQDILDLIWRQTALNFTPGDQYLYSNTGYTLLGLIVKRVSGMPLSQFARERIFQPLGMTHTHFQDDYGTVVKDRAYSYRPTHGNGYKYIALSYSTVGPSSLFTTVGDLALWDHNFSSGQVGGEQLLADMQSKGLLNDGKPIDYASGLSINTYRGLKTVGHGGADAGYRTNILRFPDQRLTVIILANAADLNVFTLTQRVADIFLADSFPSPPEEVAQATASKSEQIKIDPKILETYIGDYALNPLFVITFTKEGDQLFAQATGQEKYPVFPSSENTFFWKVVDAYFTFDKPTASGEVAGGVHHQNGRDIPATRIVRIAFTPEHIRDYQGDFYSDELRAIYTVTYKDGTFHLRYPRGDISLSQVAPDKFVAEYPIGALRFSRGKSGRCDGFTINDGRVQQLRFDKVAISPLQME